MGSTVKFAAALAFSGCLCVMAAETRSEDARPDQTLKPMRSIQIEVPIAEISNLIDRLNIWAQSEGFATRVKPPLIAEDSYLLQFFREDLRVIGTNGNPRARGHLSLSIYKSHDTTQMIAIDYVAREMAKVGRSVPQAKVTETPGK
ncbi:hypothetical protein [Inquilinus sp. CA228]|uniref:hypothetical protein n=1 Tax=Inquilinus sp. CA228 TaxID=3455609 RepID=UPI003F8D067C